MLRAQHIVFTRRRQKVLNGATITLNHGEVVALIGANGVGKTTLLHLIAGYLEPRSGHIQRDCTPEQIALLADKPALYPDWSVQEALQRIATLYGISSARIQSLITEFNLHDVLTQACKYLSHGYQQRVAMAQMLLTSPKLILLDEPANGLDDQQKRALWPLLAHLKRDAAVLLISHDWTEVTHVADRVYVLKNGVCCELPLPHREDDWWWYGFCDAETALSACPDAVCYDGRFAALPAHTVYQSRQIHLIIDHYPAQALQDKMDELA